MSFEERGSTDQTVASSDVSVPYRIRNAPITKMLDLDPKALSQKDHDRIKATATVLRAVSKEKTAHPLDLADCLYVAALYNFAGGQRSEGEAQLVHIARICPDYNPKERLGVDGSKPFSSYLDHEVGFFQRTHAGFDHSVPQEVLRREVQEIKRVLAYSGS